MGYTALYRKFRPLTFSEIVGQEHITKTLKNQIISNRVGHAYLFNGGRGTGKTSAAKVLARAINCLNPKDGEPCNECEICKGAISGSITDIVEMDAASNNSVEDIRSIREEVNFLPTIAKYRVYIIDEVHMLSTGAFNALLKTLEEPPEHVKFILATTEPQKLPATILSRCQRFDFKRISNENIIKRLKIVCDESKIEISNEALNIIAVLSEGAMRDALSILERCIQDGDNKISEEKIKDLVGIPKLININRIANGIVKKEVNIALEAINEIIDEGKDLNNTIWEIIKYFKDILLFKTTNKLDIYSDVEIEDIKEAAKNISKERLIKVIYDLSEVENTMKWSSQKNIIFQTGIIKLCAKDEMNEIEELKKKINIIEEALKSGKTIDANIKKSANDKNEVQTKKAINSNQENKKQEIKDSFKEIGEKANNYWDDIINKLKNSGKIILYTNLINTNAIELNEMTLGIEFKNGLTPFGKTVLEKPENINEITRLVSMAYGKEMRIKYINKTTNIKDKENNEIENLAKNLDIPINIID